MKSYTRTSGIIYDTPWAIEQRAGQTLLSIYERRVRGQAADKYATPDRMTADTEDDSPIRMIDVFGPIIPRADLFSDVSGVCSSSSIAGQIKDCEDDDECEMIVLNIDSPGGSVLGGFECADAIYRASQHKPVIASINGLGCSLAYLFASQCSEIFCSPSSIVGSIGVISVRNNYDRMEKNAGVDSIVVASSPAKCDTGLTDSQIRDRMKMECDKFMGMFSDRLKRTRPEMSLTEQDPGLTFIGDEAKTRGLVDGVMELDEVLAFIVS